MEQRIISISDEKNKAWTIELISITFSCLVDDLIRMKQPAGWPKDAEDLKFLRRLKREKRSY